jgi:hypothetical protein
VSEAIDDSDYSRTNEWDSRISQIKRHFPPRYGCDDNSSPHWINDALNLMIFSNQADKWLTRFPEMGTFLFIL